MTIMSIEIPAGFAAVVVFVAKDEREDGRAQVKVVGTPADESEHGYIAEAIQALASAAADITDDVFEDLAVALEDPADPDTEPEGDEVEGDGKP